jgi:prevent-host-death family protein
MEVFHMIITATEFKSNLGHYLGLVGQEDIVITRNGKRIAKLTDAAKDKTDILRALTGIVPPNVSLQEAKEERLSRYENHA